LTFARETLGVVAFAAGDGRCARAALGQGR
jgi:hypothetical protein